MRARLAIALAVVLCGGASFAEGITGYVEEDYVHANSTLTDPSGNAARTSTDQFTQRYRLNLDHGFFPLLRLNAGGLFEQINIWTNGVPDSSSRSRAANGYANLLFGGYVLSGVASYNYRATEITGIPGRMIIDEPSLALNWRPADLPSFNMRIARTHTWDTAHQLEDLETLLGIGTLAWQPLPRLNLQYSFSYAQPTDHLHLTKSDQISQTGHVDWGRSFAGGATVTTALNVTDQRIEVTSTGPGSTITTLQSPITGLFLVEIFPATAEQDTLTVNNALIDSNTTVSAAIDLGYAIRAAGDLNYRDIGVQFADILTKVNTLYLWVDRQLTPEVVAGFHFDAYTSDDNVRWTKIGVVSVLFSGFQNRFEITLPVTAARYLKVVTQPLDPALTIDKRFTNIFVTELQTLLVTPVTSSTGWQDNAREVVNASARIPILVPGLVYDFNGIVSHNTATGAPPLNTWILINGLSYTRKLTKILLFDARIARQDDDQSLGHEGLFLYTASLSATPLPTLSESLVYSGQSIWNPAGFGNQNTISFYNRAIPYRGIGLLAGAAYSVTSNPDSTLLRSGSATVSGTIQPHRALTLTGTYGHSVSKTTGGNRLESLSVTDRFDGGITWNPFPALYAAGGLSRVITETRPQTLANASVSFSPFPDGTLQVGVTYSDTYQNPGQRTRILSPTARWNVRPGTMLTASYSLLETNAPAAGSSRTGAFDINLQIALL